MENKNMDVIRKFIYNKIQGENVSGISIDDDVELVENRVVTSLVPVSYTHLTLPTILRV